MRYLIVGSGSREHAISWKLMNSSIVSEVKQWVGNLGSNQEFMRLDLPSDANFTDLAELIKIEKIDAVVVGPEVMLDNGIANELNSFGIPVFGPTKEVSMLEASKKYAKEVMASAGIPTAAFELAESEEQCLDLARKIFSSKGGVVVKASGLAGGKGVFVCHSEAEIDSAIERLYHTAMSSASGVVVVEEELIGRECSYFVCLGKNDPISLGFAVDFKRLADGDSGPNTGGMGCYTPVPWLPENAASIVTEQIVDPLVKELNKRGHTYTGFLYVGLMWSESGPYVVEFNVRLGDPEAQVLAYNDKNDWGKVISRQLGLYDGDMSYQDVNSASVAVVLASDGYPYEKSKTSGVELSAVNSATGDDCKVFYGSIVTDSRSVLRAGSGRTMTVVSSGESHKDARSRVYQLVEKLGSEWPEAQYRKDIAGRF